MRLVLPRRIRADGTTIALVYLVALAAVPSGLILQGLPLSISPAELIALGMMLLWLCAHLTRNLGMAKGPVPVRTGVYVYVLALVATYASANYRYLAPDEGKLVDHSLVLIIGLVGMALLVCDGTGSRDRLDVLLRAVAICCAAIAVVAALQFVLDFDLTKYLRLPGLKLSSVGLGTVDDRNDFHRVAGTTGNPIEFGVLCAMVLPIGLHYLFEAQKSAAKVWRWRIICGLIASGLLFSVSRSAVVGVACAGLVLLVGWPARRRVTALVVSVVFLGLSKIIFPGLLGTILGLFTNFSNDTSISYRTQRYPIAAAEISRHPLLGRGVGAWWFPKHNAFDNQYLMTLVEGGFVGLAVLIGLFLTSLGSALMLTMRAAAPADRALALSLLASIAVPAVGAVTFDLLSFKTVTGVLFLLVGATGALWRKAPRRPTPVGPRRGLEPAVRNRAGERVGSRVS